MTRIASILALTSLTACLISKPIGDAETDSATSTSADASSGSGMTSTADVTGDPDGDPDRVDCAQQDWVVTIGGGELSALGFPIAACNPRESGEANGYKCCSTDPSTADGALPSYEAKGIPNSSPPLYADAANDAGTWGACVKTTIAPEGVGLQAGAALDCPTPCNPTWSAESIAAVCGPMRGCCQVHELREHDCVQEDGVWRPVTGADIGAAGVVPQTNWNNVSHDTHQDPNGTVCLAASGGDPSSEFFEECIRHLTVANQRGFCMGLNTGQLCPDREQSYIDACEAKNG